MTAKEPSARNPAATRQRLLDVATLAFAQSGLDGVRVDQLAQDSGVNKRMIYHYFGDKRGLYDAVVAAAEARFEAPAGIESLVAWQQQLSEQMSPTTTRLLAWEGLRRSAAPEAPSVPEPDHSEASAPLDQPGRDAADLALMFVALAVFPALCPQVVQALSGLPADAPEFDERWVRLQQRLLRLIRTAAQAPKERVRLAGKAQPSVR